MLVMVLSKDYEPLMYCGLEKAIALLYLDKAEAVLNTDLFIRSVSLCLPIPSVIRLLSKTVRRFLPPVRYSRRNILIRDKFTCQYCGSSHAMTIDHVLPLSRGGKSTWENVVAACKQCNGKKGNRLPREAGMTLAREPRVPASLYQVPWDQVFCAE